MKPLLRPELAVNNLPNLYNSVFYKQFETDSLSSLNNKTLIDLNYKPKLSLYGDGGYLSAFSFDGYKNFGLSAGISLIVPIYDGKQKQIQYDKIKIAERTRQNYRDFFIKQYGQQLIQLNHRLQAKRSL